MVMLSIKQWAFKLMFFLSQLAFIYIPGFPKDVKSFLNNISSDSSQKQRLFKCYPGLEFGYSRLKRYYHIELDPNAQVQVTLINGNKIYFGLTGELSYKTKYFLSSEIYFDYQRFQIKTYDNVTPGYQIDRDNYLYASVPLTYTIAMPFKHLKINSELGFIESFLLYSEYEKINSSGQSRMTSKYKNILTENHYSSMFFGAKMGLKNKNIFIDIKYVIGLTKIMLPGNGYIIPSFPPPNNFYRINGISLSIQYFFKTGPRKREKLPELAKQKFRK